VLVLAVRCRRFYPWTDHYYPLLGHSPAGGIFKA
jgi:hypothetical protein